MTTDAELATYDELSNCIMAAQEHIKKKFKPIKEVWLNPEERGLGFGKIKGRWQILLGDPGDPDKQALQESSLLDRIEFAGDIPKLPEVIVTSKEGFLDEVEQTIAMLIAFIEGTP